MGNDDEVEGDREREEEEEEDAKERGTKWIVHRLHDIFG